ncbi:MAG: DUF664 domain-containing protein [Actinomycetota bacterium]
MSAWCSCARQRASPTRTPADLVADRSRTERHSLRWIYVHLIEEYARHLGHADLIRQAIDGAVED